MSEIKNTKQGPDRAMVERVNAALAKVKRAHGAADVGYSLSRPFGDDRPSSTPTIIGHTRLAPPPAKSVKR